MSKKNKDGSLNEFDSFEYFDLDDFDDIMKDEKSTSGGGYIKNVFKSVKNFSVKIGSALLPEGGAIISEGKAALVEFKDQFVEYKDKAIDGISKLKGAGSGQKISRESIGEGSFNLFKSLKDDVVTRFKTGKFVKGDDDIDFNMGSLFDDMDNDESDSNENDSANGSLKQPKDPYAPIKMKLSKKLKESNKRNLELENERVQSLKETTIGAAEATVAASIDMFQKQQMMEEARHHITTQYLKNIAINIYKSTGIQAELLASQIEYGKKSLALYSDMMRSIKEVQKIQSLICKQSESTLDNDKNGLGSIFGYGFSGSDYGQGVVKNIKNLIMSSPLGMIFGMAPMLQMMGGMGGSGKGGGMKNILTSFINPLNIMLNLTMNSKIKTGKDRLDKMFQSLPALINQKLVGMSKESGLKGMIGEIFGIKDQENVVNIENYSNMDLNAPTYFDVRSKRTLNEVIPLYLSIIAAGVTDREETRYDFRSQRLKPVSSIQKEIKMAKKAAMNMDTEFSKYSEKINQHFLANFDKNNEKMNQSTIQKGMDTIQKNLVKMQEGFDEERARTDKYYREKLVRGISGTNYEKENILNYFLNSYRSLSQNQRTYYKAGMLNTKINLSNATRNKNEELINEYSGGANFIGINQTNKQINSLKDQIERIDDIIKQKYGGIDAAKSNLLAQSLINKKLNLSKELSEILSSSGNNNFINSNTVSLISDKTKYNLESKFLNVPNMLKNITDLLLGGIIVYPMNKMPESVRKNQSSQRKYLNLQTKDIEKSIKDKQIEEERLREEAFEIAKEQQQFRRNLLLGKDGIIASSGIGRGINDAIGSSFNVIQKVLGGIGGFDTNYDYRLSEDENYQASINGSKQIRGARAWAESNSSKGGLQGKLAKLSLNILAKADNYTTESGNNYLKNKEEGKTLVQQTERMLNDVKSKVSKNSSFTKVIDKIKQKIKKEPEKAAELINRASNIELSPTFEDSLNSMTDVFDDANFSSEISGILSGNFANNTKNVQKSKNIDKSKVKIINNYSSDSQNDFNNKVITKLDKIINVLENRGNLNNNFEDGVKVQRMDEILSLLVSMNSNLLRPSDLSSISKELMKYKKKGGGIFKSILSIPGKLVGASGGLIKGIGRASGGILSGAGSLLGGFTKGIGSLGAGILPAFGNLFKGVAKAGKGVLSGTGSLLGGIKSGVGNVLKSKVRKILDSNTRESLEKQAAKILNIKIDSSTIKKASSKKLAKIIVEKNKYKESFKNKLGNLFNRNKIPNEKKKNFVWDSSKSITMNLLKGASGLVKGTGSIFSGVTSRLTGIGGGKDKDLLKGLLTNTIAIRQLLESQYGPANMKLASLESDKYVFQSKSLLGKVISAPVHAAKSAVGMVGKGFNFIKNKIAGHIDRGDGSGIREGSYLDYKKDKEEAEIKEKEEMKVQYLEEIAENTKFLMLSEYNKKFEKDDSDNEGGGFNIYDALDMLPGRRGKKGKRRKRTRGKLGKKAGKVGKLGKMAGGFGKLAAGAGILGAGIGLASSASGLMSGSTTLSEVGDDAVDLIGSGARLGTGIITKFINLFGKIFSKFLSNPKVVGLVGKSFGNSFLAVFFNGVKKHAFQLSARISAWMAGTTISAGTILAAQAVAGFGWGMARAKTYFPSGTEITPAMRITAGLVKAIDWMAMGIPSLVFDLMGVSMVEMIYGLIAKQGTSGGGINDKWQKTRATEIYGLTTVKDLNLFISNKNDPNMAISLGFKSREIFDNWLERRFEPLYQIEQSLASDEIINGTSTNYDAISKYRKDFYRIAKDFITKNKIKDLGPKMNEKQFEKYSSAAATLAGTMKNNKKDSSLDENKISLGSRVKNSLVPFYSGAIELTKKIGQMASVKFEGVKEFATKAFNSLKEKWDNVKQKISDFWKGTSEFAGKAFEKAKDVGGNILNTAKDVVGGAISGVKDVGGKIVSGVTQGAKAAGGAIAGVAKRVYEKGQGFLSKNPLTENKFPKQSPSPYLVPTKSAVNILGTNPELQRNIIGFAQHYYDITGKPLVVTSAKRSLQDQIRLWEREAKVKWTGNEGVDKARAQKAGGKYYNYNGGVTGYPKDKNRHILGEAIDINMAATPYDKEVNAEKRHWLFDDILEKYGLKRPYVKANNPNAGTLERWHIELSGKKATAFDNEEPPEASVAEQKIDGVPQEKINSVNEAMNTPSSVEDQGVGSSQTYVNSTGSSTSSSSSSSSGSTSSSSATSSSSGTVKSTSGVANLNEQMAEISNLLDSMNKIEGNTRKTNEILENYLPGINIISQLVSTLIQVTVNQSSGYGSSESAMNSANNLLATGNF